MVKISSDSACDLSTEILQALEIAVTPLHIVVGADKYRDNVDITPRDLYRYVEAEGKTCLTTAINQYEYHCHFAELSPQYDAVIHINLGSAFSSCYQNALLAAQDFPNVYVMDSCNLSTGSGYLVYEAAQMVKTGANAQEILSRLQSLVPKIEASFVINQLDYLHKGGRCSSLAAHSGTILKIKPCIEVSDGKMTLCRKYRGSIENCLVRYVKNRLADRDDIAPDRVFITHSQCAPDIVTAVEKAVQQHGNFRDIIITEAGCTIANHCGPNTLGILFSRK